MVPVQFAFLHPACLPFKIDVKIQKRCGSKNMFQLKFLVFSLIALEIGLVVFFSGKLLLLQLYCHAVIGTLRSLTLISEKGSAILAV